jgi:hypothetical protein
MRQARNRKYDMNTMIDAVVSEIARSVDLEICRSNPSFEKLHRNHRMYLLLSMLETEGVASKDSSCPTPRWGPSKRLDTFFGVERHGIEDTREDVAPPTALLTLGADFSKALLSFRAQKLEKEIGLVVSIFAMCRLGMVEYRGRNSDGACEFRAAKGFKKKMREYEKSGLPTNVIEIRDDDGPRTFFDEHQK